jgi:hypothetical protein
MSLYRFVEGGNIHFGGPRFGHNDLDNNFGSLLFIMRIKGNPQLHKGGIFANFGDSIGGDGRHQDQLLCISCGL